MQTLAYLCLKLPRNVEVSEEASKTFLSALKDINYVSPILKLFGKKPPALSLEIILSDGQIRFFSICDETIAPFIETQIKASYPLCVIEKLKQDPLENFPNINMVSIQLTKGNFYPISTYDSFKETDPMTNMLSVLSKASGQEKVAIQIALESINDSWQQQFEKYAEQGEKRQDGTYSPRPDASVILEKTKEPGFGVAIRFAAQKKETLTSLISAMGVYTRAGGNALRGSYPNFFTRKRTLKSFLGRRVTGGMILNIKEIASIWHLPSEKVKVPGIEWGKNVLSDPPENLPVAYAMTEEEKKTVNFFAKIHFRNTEAIFGIKERDRLRHIWALGKTGTGKSTMLENMAIDDFRKDRGVAFIDPHGAIHASICLNLFPNTASTKLFTSILPTVNTQ
ncbi:MAG: type IV secretory system conjugative DNA transfer family protein [Patescibacteria group bacterium]|nr:type IV secretory system conjugative DNA transfer family protein [Patescibacteria group bacterium]